MTSNNNRNKNLVILIATIAATGGLLFGFDTGVISGAQNFLQDPGGWGISDDQLEWVTTAVLIGAVLGAALSGRITDILGRRKVIMAMIRMLRRMKNVTGSFWNEYWLMAIKP